MAKFIGTQEHFIKFIGGYARNKIQYITSKYRKDIGHCECCGSEQNLQAAHIKGRDRLTIIAEILSEYSNEDIVEIDLLDFENRYIAEHEPVDKSIKILCRDCHFKYDSKDFIDFNELGNIETEAIELKAKVKECLVTRKNKKLLIESWNSKPWQLHHRAIALYIDLLNNKKNITREEFVDTLARNGYKNAYGTVSSLMTDGGNSYGKIFVVENNFVQIIPELKDEILGRQWTM